LFRSRHCTAEYVVGLAIGRDDARLFGPHRAGPRKYVHEARVLTAGWIKRRARREDRAVARECDALTERCGESRNRALDVRLLAPRTADSREHVDSARCGERVVERIAVDAR